MRSVTSTRVQQIATSLSRSLPGDGSEASRSEHLRVAGRLQHNRSMKHVVQTLATAAAAMSLVGCFYTADVNQRPSIAIEATTSSALTRASLASFTASGDDPDGDAIFYRWRAYVCTDATDPAGCDTAPFYGDAVETISFDVPAFRADGVTPTAALRVVLEGTDARGATADPSQVYVAAVGDAPPDLALRKVMRAGYVVGAPIALFAAVGDPDDGASNVKPLDWAVFTPASAPAYTLVDASVPQNPADPTHIQSGKTFTPMGIGDWDIQVTATDPTGATTQKDLMITVAPDHPPCLAQWAPTTAPTGAALPISMPTLFQVLSVQDDLDVYPSDPSDPILGTATFTWSLLPPGATTRQVIAGATSASVPIDPSAYSPGDVLELRVEIQDRQHLPVNCPDADPTCSLTNDATCIQRLTWRVEAQ